MRIRKRLGTATIAALVALSLPISALGQGDVRSDVAPDYVSDVASDVAVDTPTDRVTDKVSDAVSDRPSDVASDRCDIRRFATTHDGCVSDRFPHDLNIRNLIYRLIHAGEWAKLVRLLHWLGWV